MSTTATKPVNGSATKPVPTEQSLGLRNLLSEAAAYAEGASIEVDGNKVTKFSAAMVAGTNAALRKQGVTASAAALYCAARLSGLNRAEAVEAAIAGSAAGLADAIAAAKQLPAKEQ